MMKLVKPWRPQAAFGPKSHASAEVAVKKDRSQTTTGINISQSLNDDHYLMMVDDPPTKNEYYPI